MTETVHLPVAPHPDTVSRMIRRLNAVWMQLYNPRLKLRERYTALRLLEKWRKRFSEMLARRAR